MLKHNFNNNFDYFYLFEHTGFENFLYQTRKKKLKKWMSKSNQCHGDKKVKSIDWIENFFCQIANLKILFLYIDYFYLANEKKKNARYRKTAFLTSRWAATFFLLKMTTLDSTKFFNALIIYNTFTTF